MKKKLILVIAIILNISYFCYAQPADGPLKRAEALHIAYITKELSLTTTEAETFWPIYRNYIDELRAARKDNRTDQIALEESVLITRKKYKPDFKRILGSDERVNKLFITERNFKDILRKELMNRRMQRNGLKEPE